MTADEVYDRTLEWAKEYDDEYYTVLSENESKAKLMMDLDRGGKKPRKDIAKWSEVKDYFSYFYPMYYKKDYTLPENITPSDAEKNSHRVFKGIQRGGRKGHLVSKDKGALRASRLHA